MWLGDGIEATVGAGGAFYTRAPAGTWTARFSGISPSLHAVFGAGAALVSVGANGTLRRFDGQTVSVQPLAGLPASTTFYGIWAADAEHFVAVGGSAAGCREGSAAGGEGIAIHLSPGVSWSQPSLPSAGALCAVWGSAWDDLFAVGEGGTVLRYHR